MNLIGINGYIGSGKDTVGRIIQWLTSRAYIVKGRSFEMFCERQYHPETFGEHYVTEWEIKKFAAKLKQIASILTGIPAEKFEDQEFKKTNLGMDWADWRVDGDDSYMQAMTVREFLQKLGTEGIRNGVHTNAWVNALFADYKPEKYNTTSKDEYSKGKPLSYDGERYPQWIITDVRFPNEARAMVERGGKIVRINRHSSYGGEGIKGHPSEVSLDDWKFDWTINNNGSIEDLTDLVKRMLIGFNIIS